MRTAQRKIAATARRIRLTPKPTTRVVKQTARALTRTTTIHSCALWDKKAVVDYRLRGQIDNLEMQLENYRREVSGSERTALEAAQTRADAVAALFGESVSGPIQGEDVLTYRKRLAMGFQKHSPQLKNSRLLKALDAGSFALCEEQIYNDAVAAAHTAPMQPGVLKAVESRDHAGRLITRYVGDIGAFLQPFTLDGVAGRINRNPS